MTETTTLDTDVVVIGGGPAGSAAAYTLLSNEFDVVLIDKKPRERIGDKVCGDALSPYYYEEVHKQIGFPLPPDNARQFCDKVVIRADDTQQLMVPSYSGTVDREIYGQVIIDALTSFNRFNLLDNTRFVDVIVEDNYVKGVRCNQKGKLIKVRANVTLDCSGTSSVVRRNLPDKMVKKMGKKTDQSQRFVAFREIIEFDEPHDFQDGLYIMNQPELEELGGAYYWVFCRSKTKVNVGLGYLIPKGKNTNIKELNKQIRQRLFEQGNVLKSQGDQIPARLPLHSCVHNGFLVIGDAAGLANPLNGEGHGPALLAGMKAGQLLSEKLPDKISEQDLWEYNQYIYANYGKIYAWGIAILKLMNTYGTEIYDDIIQNDLITQEDVYTIVNEPDNTISQMKILKRGWKHPILLYHLYKTKKHADHIRDLADTYPQSPDDGFEEWVSELERFENYYS